MTVKIFGSLDVGYNRTKGFTKSQTIDFMSVTGSPDGSGFGYGNSNGFIELVHPRHVAVGEQVIEQSRSKDREIDRGWIDTDKWKDLFYAGLSEMTTATAANLHLVMGLPLSFYSDKERVQENVMGAQTFQRKGRTRQTLTVQECRVIPQGFGCLFDQALNDSGKIVDQGLKNSRVAVVDIGGRTTNFLLAHKLRMIDKDSMSCEFGGWNVVRAVWDYLKVNYPGVTVDEYGLVEHVISRSIKIKGEPVDLTPVVNQAARDLARDVISQARRLWNGAELINAVLVCGGAAHLVGEHILAHYGAQARIVENPTFSNARGYFKFAQAVFSSNNE